jgi:hypothetical protein
VPRAEVRTLEVFICAKDIPFVGMIEQDHTIHHSGPDWRLTDSHIPLSDFCAGTIINHHTYDIIHKTAAESRRSFSTLEKAI